MKNIQFILQILYNNVAKKFWVTIEYKEKRSIIDIKKTLSKYYKNNDNTRLYKCFNWDLKKDKVELTLDSNGYYIIVEK